MDRRGLLKALGLGGVGLFAGAPSLIVSSVSEAIPKFDWVHPQMEKIEAFMTLTGGYPNIMGKFDKSVAAWCGDTLNINYTIEGPGFITPVILYRVYDVRKAVTVIGTSVQGPVVDNGEGGHRLATADELFPDNQASLEKNPEFALHSNALG